jgi:phage gpG-like protein
MSQPTDPRVLMQKLTALKGWFNKDFPRMVAVRSEQWVKGNFRKGGYDGGKWNDRKIKEGNGKRAILIKRAFLRDSIRSFTTSNTVFIVSNSPYAKLHNEGGTVVQTPSSQQRGFFWAKHTEAKKAKRTAEADRWKYMALAKVLNITMPQRQFMPVKGQALPKSLENLFVQDILKKLNDFKI